VGAYLEKRHETALRLLAALDKKLKEGGEDPKLRVKREQLSIESDTLLKALQVHEEREELLENAEEILGDGAPDTSAYLRKVLVYLDARSKIVLKLIANIDQRLGASPSADERGHLEKQRSELVSELDAINEKIAGQKRGESQLKACGLQSEMGDPYHVKVTQYLQNRSDVALQLIAFLDARLERLNGQEPEQAEEREKLAARREKLMKDADEALAQIDQQEQGQALMDSLGVSAKAKKVQI